MKKRFVCFLLTLMLLVSLVPATALTASAASYGVSNSAITVLKKMVSYNRYCYRVADSSEFRVGYGTICTDQHKWVRADVSGIGVVEIPAIVDSKGKVKIMATNNNVTTKFGQVFPITSVMYDGELLTAADCTSGHYMGESAADTALRKSLAEIDKKVDSFASSNNVTLNQSKHDALTILTYLTGSAWMSGTNATKTAIINNAGAAEMVSAIAKNYGTANADAEARAKVLTNMYINGVYANIAPSNYTTVKYKPNEGSLTDASVAGTTGEYTYYFDANQEIGHPVIPTRQGYTFTGWYLQGTDGTYKFMPKLNGECAGQTLVAKWQRNDNSSAWGTVLTNAQLADAAHLYAEPKASAGTWDFPAKFTKIKISTTYVDTDGIKWAKIAEGEAVYDSGADKWLDAGSYAKKWVKLNASASVLVSEIKTKWDASQLKFKALYTDPDKNANHEQTLSGSVTSIQASKEYVDLNGVRWVYIEKAFEGSTDVTGTAAFEKDGKTKTTAAGKWVILNTGANGGISIGAASGAVAKATITYQGYVNVRSAAGTNNGIVGSVRNNETVDVFEIVTCNGHKWGRINGGWICLTYANVIMLNGNSDVDISSEGALAYTFSGRASQEVPMSAVHVSPNANSNTIDKAVSLKYKPIAKDTDVTVTNMTLTGSELWVKILWTAKYEDAYGKEQSASAQGWVKITNNASNVGYDPATLVNYSVNPKVTLGASSFPIQLWPVRYTVSASEITVRDKTRSDGNIVFKMNQGVQFDAWEIALVGEDVWGFCREVTDVNDKYDPEAAPGTYECGWANLSSKYVSRTSLPGVVTKPATNQYAVIVNCTAAKVRIGAGLYNTPIGTLPAGTEANILEYDEENGWYNLDVDVDNDPETGSWVFEQYVEVREGTIGQSNGAASGVTTTNPDGSSTTVTTVRKGIVANTYGGLNVRQGPGTGYGQAGKLMPGTSVDIYEIVKSGTADWGRIDQGWVCMNYITLLSTTTTTTTTNGGNGTGVKDFETLAKTSTTAVYTGVAASNPDQLEISESAEYAYKLHVWTTPKHNLTPEYAVCQLNPGDPVTIYELLAVTEVISNTNTGDDSQSEIPGMDHGVTAETTITSYWARTNDGYIFNPQKNLVLNPLDEVVHTLTGSDTLNVRDAANGNVVGELKKGDQVKVTELAVVQDKVWGKIEYDAAETGSDANGFSYGWVRLDYFSEGAYYIEKSETTTTTTGNPNGNTQGNTGNTYSGGYVPGANASGYRYTAKVNYEGLNVRNTPSTSANSNAQLKKGQSIVIYETTINENMAWGRCDGGWVYLYYVDLTPVVNGAVDARVVYNDNTIIYSDSTGSSTVGTYARMSVIDIYEIVGKMARTDQGWVNTDNLLP